MRHSIIPAGFFALLLCAGAAVAESQDIRGTARAIDGDTLEVGGVVVDLRGIDAPEPAQTCDRAGKTIPCGDIARWALMDLIAGTEVVCRPGSGTRTGPSRAALCTAGGFDISANMVHTGWAVTAAEGGESYRATQIKARDAGRGLWGGRFMAPWDWRARHRE